MRNVNTTNALLNVVANRCDRTLDAGLVVACAPTHVPAMRLYPTAPAMSALVSLEGHHGLGIDQGKRQGSLLAIWSYLERIATGTCERLTQISGSTRQFAQRFSPSFGQRWQVRSNRQVPE